MKKGFTIVEVILVLTVIGVVSAITIPTMINRINQKSTIEQLKKIAATLNQAVYNATILNGELESWSWTADEGPEIIMKDIINPRLNIGFSCTGDDNQDCVYNITGLDGTEATLAGTANFPGNGRVLLNDGTMVALGTLADPGDPAAASNPCVWRGDRNALCGIFMVDVNGSKKPNVVGKDVFYYGIYLSGSILPYGSNETSDDPSVDFVESKCADGADGTTCAAKLAKDGWEVKTCPGGTSGCNPYPLTF